ncbi:MAG TPA: outer membrane protein transport protein [Salinimicrobium sp.]|nr:outer membrane protein transport protein [Salinimicrobium sp.]
MKRLIFAFIAMTTMAVEAQNITDAVRYSSTELNGTARFRAMSGAFGALGGDLSSIKVNPAGSAVFLSSIATLSLDFTSTDNEVGYFGEFSSSSLSNIELGQGGAVFVFNNMDQESNWRKFTVGLNYSQTAAFDNEYAAIGTSPISIDRYFLGYAEGIPLDLLEPLENETVSELYSFLGENEGFGAQQALLGYQGFIINAVEPGNFDNTSYVSALSPGDFRQESRVAATGMNGMFSFNFATQFKDNLYLGVNLNSHFLNYDRITTLYETNDNPGSGINEIYFENRLSTLGSGFSFQLGAIAKLSDQIRMGASYKSPTWYTISEETTQYLETFSNEFGEAVVNPNVVNIYPDYKLQTPSEYTGSFAYLFGDSGLISFDYTYKDYSSIKFKPAGDREFAFQNDLIENNLKGASIYRIGAEYRIADWSLRGGYRFEESPYENEMTIGDLTGYSVGLGYDFGSISMGLAYDMAQQERNPQLYQVGLTNRANINRDMSNFTISLSFGI